MVERARGRVSPSRVLLVASFGAFLAFLDATIVNVAFPSIRASFPGSSIGALSWVLNAYNIVFAAFLVVCGRLTDLIGRRRAYTAGIALFTLASCWCAAAGSLEMLVAGRVVQALGSAMLVPASLALVIEAFPGPRRSHAIGLWGATAAIAAGLGPPLGGALVQMGGWRWAFLVNLPFGLVAIAVSRRTLVESRSPGRRTLPDLVGAMLLALTLGLVNFGIIKASDWGWSNPKVISSFVAAVVIGLLFVQSSRRHRAPVVDPALVRIPSFGIACVATILAGLGFYAYLLNNILWLRYIWQYSVLGAGLALVPGALVAAIVAARLGPLAERVGYRVLVVPGALVWAGAYVWYHQMVGLTPDFWAQWLPGQVLSGVGVGATLPLLGSAALAAVPGGRYATASALVSSARQLGGVLGISLLVLVVGTPDPATIADRLEEGWVLSIVAFLCVAVVAVPLGRIRSSTDDEVVEHGQPRVLRPHAPAPDARVPDGAHPMGLDAVPLLAALPDDARWALTAACRTVELAAGSWLFEEGDPPGSAYVLRGGRLEVVLGGRVVRTLTPGAVLGELALLTGEPRSAGVRGRRDASLLEVPREAFEQLVDTDVRATRTVLSQVAGQLRTAGSLPPPERTPQPRVVAVVGLHAGSGAPDVGAALLTRLAVHVATVDPGHVDTEGLARAEADHERVLLVADGGEDTPWRDFCLRQADAVVLVARSDVAVPDLDHLLGRGAMPTRPDVVLLGAAPTPEVRSSWVAATDAWQLVQVTGELHAGVRALADRLAGRSLGLVLAGGGARAFAHIGVLQGLAESGHPVDRIAGSSVGAIVAALHAVGMDGQELEATCYAEFVRRRPFSDWTLPRYSLARGARQSSVIGRTFGPETFEGLPRQLHVASTDLVGRRRVVHRRGNVGDAVIASSRLPVLFPPVATDDGQLLLDGGVLDNLPVDLLFERDEGPVVAVNISMGGSGPSRPRQGRPRVPPLGDTLLRTMMIGAGGAVDAAHERGALVLTPTAMGVGLLEFHQFDRMVRAGREAARALLADGFLTDRMTASEPARVVQPDTEPPAVSAEGAVAPA